MDKINGYDPGLETVNHIGIIKHNIDIICEALEHRAALHDKSKLEEPEKSIFDKYTPKLSTIIYGSDEYKEMLLKMKPAIYHHNKNNRHHPEFFQNGIKGMNLIDITEMLCDWIAATKRNPGDDIFKSIEYGATRFEYSDDLKQILINTALILIEEKEN